MDTEQLCREPTPEQEILPTQDSAHILATTVPDCEDESSGAKPCKVILRTTRSSARATRARQMERLRRRKLNLAKKAHEFHRDFQQDFNTDVFLVVRTAGKYLIFDSSDDSGWRSPSHLVCPSFEAHFL